MSLRPFAARPAPATPRERLEQVLWAGLDVYAGGAKARSGKPAPSKPPPFSGDGFVYLVADSVAGVQGPVILLVGEKGYPSTVKYTSSKRTWSPPGGGYKPQDGRNLMNTAWREFWEETGADLSKLYGYQWKPLRMGKKSAIMMLRINLPAERVENIIGLKAAGADLNTKMHTELSKETKGYVWVTLDAMKNANKDGVIQVGPSTRVQMRSWRTYRKDVLDKIV